MANIDLNYIFTLFSLVFINLSTSRQAIPKKNLDNLADKLFDQVSTERIAKNLRQLTRKVFTQYDRQIDDNTLYVFNKWNDQGIQTSLLNYTVLLSLANTKKPNKVSKYDSSGTLVHQTNPYEDPLNASPVIAKQFKLNPGYLAYTPSTPQPLKGIPVYVNYGTYDDYDYLKKLGIDVKGHIVVAKYGKSFRGNIVERAERMGAIGVIVYSDPFDFTDGNFNNTYPDSIYLPETGVQRGTTLIETGDPQTPFYPSIDSAYRLPINETNLPRIPVQPISYKDAKYILRGLNGPPAPKEWVGKLDLEYRIGPGYEDESYLVMEINNQLKPTVIHNVIGIIKGCIEPDRYVIIGNHRDAWSLGAIDPLSGTATLLELSEILSKMVRNKEWCPRRSIVFASWGAEEQGLMGSTEWVEENQKMLYDQAIAYINIDCVVMGNHTFMANASPLLFENVWSATKQVTNPNPMEVNEGLTTVYDSYKIHRPSNISGEDRPKIQTPGSGSDYAAFLQYIGVPVADFIFDCEESHIQCYPLYHTMYETYELVSEMVDKGFLYNKAMAQICLQILISLSDTPLLPLAQSLEHYPRFLERAASDLTKSEYKQLIIKHQIEFDYLFKAINEFKLAINDFREEINELDLNNELGLRRVNDILMSIDRSFIDSEGMPTRRQLKNVLLAPSSVDAYKGSVFAGAYDLLWQLKRESDERQQKNILNEIRKYISVLIFHINSAKLVVKQSLN